MAETGCAKHRDDGISRRYAECTCTDVVAFLDETFACDACCDSGSRDCGTCEGSGVLTADGGYGTRCPAGCDDGQVPCEH
jgi:hypothetical protein